MMREALRRLLSPFAGSAHPNHNRTGNQTMRMISEKAIAFLLALALSGTAFNTFIV